MISLEQLKERYEYKENVNLSKNLKQNTVEEIQAYQAAGLNIIPLKPHSKAPDMMEWTSNDKITSSEFYKYAKQNCNYGLRLDYQFEDANYLVAIDIEDTAKEYLLKHFVDALDLDVNNLPWTRTQSGAMHLYLKTDRVLTPFQMSGSDGEGVVVELRMGRNQQNVIGPSIYKDGAEEREYITYGNILDAPYVDADLLLAACYELDEVAPSAKSTEISFNKIADVESENIVSAIEFLSTKRITREEWINCGFALINKFGKAAKPYFLQLSNNKNFPDDTMESVTKQFNNLLKSTKGKFTIGTLFHIASKYGFELSGVIANAECETTTQPCPIPFDEELEAQFLLDDTRDPNKLLGFPLTKFKELASHVDGLQPGFYLLGAESNIGKTAVLTNMCLDVLETNPDVTVIYFSLDDSRMYTAKRFLSIMTQLSINDTSKKQTDPVKAKDIINARGNLLGLIRSGRLIVKDIEQVSNVEQLKAEIKQVLNKSKLVVFIDGLYNLEVGEKFKGGIREENIERARQVKQLVDIYRMPILTTGELRKKTKEEGKDKAPTVHDLMETGKFAYNANVVWLLYGKVEDLKSAQPILTLEYVKNKLSDFKGIQNLEFTRATGTMEEITNFLSAPPNRSPLFSDGGSLD